MSNHPHQKKPSKKCTYHKTTANTVLLQISLMSHHKIIISRRKFSPPSENYTTKSTRKSSPPSEICTTKSTRKFSHPSGNYNSKFTTKSSSPSGNYITKFTRKVQSSRKPYHKIHQRNPVLQKTWITNTPVKSSYPESYTTKFT